ncbi:TonB-dependent receptor [Pseudogemmatithrix spongiicola]|uniref:TonB-dependent receptor n=1 Tax=Pseudogemmatithrix spongiicola TaxID=3062599 RepID=A0AA49Q4M7_9BACT|nr:TonB-dependent receptor [Gemmatimonadaceae bacterium 'strain 138']
MRRALLLFATVLLAPIAATTGSAATLAGKVHGIVTDSAGVALPNATVIVAELGRATTTDAEGKFTIRGVPVGDYHLSVMLLGYAPGHLVVRVPAEDSEVLATIRLTATPLRLTAMVVAASPTGTESDRLTQAALELSGRSLSRALGSSVAASLAGEPGVSQRYSGPVATMPVIRGLTGDRILILQDGERAGDLASSAADHGISVDPLAAQRLEVVRGPATLLYGNSALGGVVNVVSNDIPTAVPGHFEGYVATQGETVTPGGAFSAGGTMAVGDRSAVSVRAGLRELGGLRTGGGTTLSGTDSRALNATVGYGLIGERANAGLALRVYDFEYGIPSAPGDPRAGVRLNGRRVGLSGKGGVQLRSRRISYLRVEGTVQDFAQDEIEPGGEVGTSFSLKTQTLNAQATTGFGRVKGALGVQGLFKQYAASGEEALTPGANSVGLGIFLFQEIALSRLRDHDSGTQLQIGARWDRYAISSDAGNAKFGPAQTSAFNNFSGSLGASVRLSDAFSLSGSLASAFRAPTVEELHSNGVHAANGSYDVGNPSLRAERSLGAELIARLRSGRVSAQVAAYSNAISNYVTTDFLSDTIVDGTPMPLARFVQANASLRGVEGSIETRVGEAWVASLSGDLVRGALADGGGPLPFLPPARIGGGLRWELARRFVATDIRHGFKQDRVTGGVDAATAAYTLVNVSAGQQWLVGNVLHRMTLRVDNLADARYFDAASRIKRFAANPGRNVSLIYQLQF